MRIYNLFPLLAGEFKHWPQHIDRAAGMGFDWVFVNPIQKPGRSGSLYSIADYFAIHPKLINRRSRKKPETQIKEVIRKAEKQHGVRFMIDLVINHCAIDSDLVKKHPQWFARDGGGKIEHPYCLEDGEKVVWYDLARFDHQHTREPEALYQYFLKIVKHYIGLGFKGFRCDAAYQIPKEWWQRLIHDIKNEHEGIVFAAETLGCTADQTRETAQAGFDYIFNSSKWWDFSSPWLIEQYQLLREFVPSISFPESHDTPRLYQESGGNVHVLEQRYAFAALFSAGVMMPMGFEFGFETPLHVVHSKPEDWEATDIDLTGFIRQINRIKADHKVFQEDGPLNVLSHDHSPILFFWKASHCSREEALVILNKDPWHKQTFQADNLYDDVQSKQPLRDISLEYPLDYIPTPYHFELNPGSVRVMVTARK